MRQTALLLAVLLCPAAPALAQVTIDLRALDALPNARPAKPDHALARRAPANPAAQPHVAARHTPSAPTRQQATATPAMPHGTPAPATTGPAAPPTAPVPTGQATPAPTQQHAVAGTAPPSPATPAEAPHETPTPPPATLPTAPPAVVALAPIAPPPQQPAPEPPPPPISNTTTSAATAIGNGLQVTFGTGQTDLSAASETAIEQLVRNTQTSDNTSFNIVAYAAGTPEDPSTARRLSLTRALSVRQALIAGGVSSARIYVRALGSAAGTGPADRVDLTVLGANLPTAIPTSGSAPPPPRQSQQQ